MKKILLILVALLMFGCVATTTERMQKAENSVNCIESGIYEASMYRFAWDYPKDCRNEVSSFPVWMAGRELIGRNSEELKCGHISMAREFREDINVGVYVTAHVQRGIISVTLVHYFADIDCYIRHVGYAYKIADLE